MNYRINGQGNLMVSIDGGRIWSLLSPRAAKRVMQQRDFAAHLTLIQLALAVAIMPIAATVYA